MATTLRITILFILAMFLPLAAMGAETIVTSTSAEAPIQRTLSIGALGADVQELQVFLSSMTNTYPERLVTGYFGRLTQSAVRRFQSLMNIEPVGVVGPKTRSALNTLMLAAASASGQAHRSPKADPATPATPASPATPATPASGNAAGPATPATPALPATPAKKVPGVNDGAAPTIADVAASASASEVVITWMTDEPATSGVLISPTWGFETAIASSSTELVQNHRLAVSGLASDSVYYYVVSSSDAAGNISAGAKNQFTTSETVTPSATPYSIRLQQGQYLAISDSLQNGLDFAGNFTIEAWIKMDTLDGILHTFVSKYRSKSGPYNSNFASYMFGWENYTSGFIKPHLISLLASSNIASFEDANPSRADYLEVGRWYHVAMTFDSARPGSGRFYVDGTDRGMTGDIFRTLNDSIADFVIGASDEGKSDFLKGSVDEVRVWNRTRTNDEIRRDYRATLTGQEQGLVGYWKMDNELVNGKVKDSSPSGNHLTLVNGPVFSTDVPPPATALPTPPPTGTTTPPTATTTPPVATSTPPTATSSPLVSTSTKFVMGDRVQTTAPLNVRISPSLSSSVLGTHATSSLGTILGGPILSNGFNWWQVDYDALPDGWSVENYLQKMF